MYGNLWLLDRDGLWLLEKEMAYGDRRRDGLWLLSEEGCSVGTDTLYSANSRGRKWRLFSTGRDENDVLLYDDDDKLLTDMWLFN